MCVRERRRASCTCSAPPVYPCLRLGGVAVVVVILVLVFVAAGAGSSPLTVVELLIGSGVLTTWVYGHSPRASSAPARV